jgi:tRNA G18 (ribose-2'-O)-methylase SpoU
MSAKGDTEISSEKLVDGKLIGQEKRRKWQAKQENKAKRQKKEEQWEQLLSQYGATRVYQNDVQSLNESTLTTNAKLIRPYLDLQDGGARKSVQGDSSTSESLFIAEGTETVRLLIQQSTQNEDAIEIVSIFVKPSVLFEPPVSLLTNVKEAGANCDDSRPPWSILVGDEETLSSVAGFHIARGALACGVVPDRDEAWLLDYYLPKLQQDTATKNGGLRLLALDGISDTANLGSMIRCASAFGVRAIIMSRDCCDAWYRRSVRVSMGHVFLIPIVRVDNLGVTIQRLSSSREPFSVTSYAAVIDTNADLILEDVKPGTIPNSWCCVMGNEANGISKHVIKACNHTIRIGMTLGVDSLSVPIATGILLHGLQEKELASK